MSEKKGIKITTIITEQNRNKIKDIVYITDQIKKDVINEALEIGLDKILKRLEKEKSE